MPENVNNYPANSHKSKDPGPKKTERAKQEKVISGSAKRRKVGLGRRVADTFTGDDANTVGEYILFDVVIPAVKAIISDATSQGIERMLFGDVRRRPNGGPRIGGGTYTNYNQTSPRASTTGRAFESESSRSRTMSAKARATHEFDEIILPTRGDAEVVLERLTDILSQYDVVTVADLYDLVGITGSYTDNKWGWFNLRDSGVEQIREGYLLNLPRTLAVD